MCDSKGSHRGHTCCQFQTKRSLYRYWALWLRPRPRELTEVMNILTAARRVRRQASTSPLRQNSRGRQPGAALQAQTKH
ncbi:hypothetical protein SKAU_G00259400 [Synaphobranchus kaupii]|uniref:Uncharacterized protein n=1 Tax=Synaphobranchus kaupii TaxID=118154 RepID=A0A9Q1ISN7_SYNKA|nr:hypothetical protein SKAU_G00259400 [Synaphobranchus kaupii]